jgi:hypothetical protein
LLQRRQLARRHGIGHPRPALVKQDQARKRRKALEAEHEIRELPRQLDVRDPAGHIHQIDQPLADHLVGDVHVIRLRVPGLWKLNAAHRLELESGIVPQYRRLQLLELPARLDPELLDEHTASLAVGGKCLRLPARAVEGEHELGTRPLAERLLRDVGLELTDEGRVAVKCEVRLEALLERRQAKLLQPQRLGADEGLIGEVAKRRPPPERKRFAQVSRRRRRIVLGERSARFFE